jgi:hypothetical protein
MSSSRHHDSGGVMTSSRHHDSGGVIISRQRWRERSHLRHRRALPPPPRRAQQAELLTREDLHGIVVNRAVIK